MMMKMRSLGGGLTTTAAPFGILSFEFAWGRERAASILNSWKDENQIEPARKQVKVDFLFLILYPLALALFSALIASSRFNSLETVGLFISWAVLVAMPLDAIENVSLLRMLDHGASNGLARIAAWCAGIKFSLVFAALGYIVFQGIGVLIPTVRGSLP